MRLLLRFKHFVTVPEDFPLKCGCHYGGLLRCGSLVDRSRCFGGTCYIRTLSRIHPEINANVAGSESFRNFGSAYQTTAVPLTR